jgi:hypothetical protein
VKLIIAPPSPFARKARIALLEKGLAHGHRGAQPLADAHRG